MVKSFYENTMDPEEPSIKKYEVTVDGVEALYDKDLSHFTNSQSLKFFERFKLKKNFLKSNPESWNTRQSYVENREKLKKLLVVNDCSERAVHLTQEYINILTKDEDQKQYLIQFVDEIRQNLLKTSNKQDLLKTLKTHHP